MRQTSPSMVDALAISMSIQLDDWVGLISPAALVTSSLILFRASLRNAEARHRSSLRIAAALAATCATLLGIARARHTAAAPSFQTAELLGFDILASVILIAVLWSSQAMHTRVAKDDLLREPPERSPADRTRDEAPGTSRQIPDPDRQSTPEPELNTAVIVPLEDDARLILEHSPIAKIVVDPRGAIVLLNAAAERVFGYSRAELIGRPIETLLATHLRTDHAAHRMTYMTAPLVRAMGTGRDLHGLRNDGSQVPVEIGLSPLSTPGGHYVLASIIDITSRKSAEHAARESAAALEATNQELSQLVQFASHDLQEPLRKLTSFTKLLEEDLPGDLNESARKDLRFIIDAAQRMQCLVRGLLELSSSGRRALVPSRFSLGHAVKDALMALELRIRDLGATVVVDDLPEVTGDRVLLTQLFQNLIGNAMKFVAKGVQPIVHVTMERHGHTTVFGVQDNGIGIKASHVSRLFRPFVRLHTRQEYEGTGIGLAICSKAVERHGGKIWLESEEGKGTHFQFTLGETVLNPSSLQT